MYRPPADIGRTPTWRPSTGRSWLAIGFERPTTTKWTIWSRRFRGCLRLRSEKRKLITNFNASLHHIGTRYNNTLYGRSGNEEFDRRWIRDRQGKKKLLHRSYPPAQTVLCYILYYYYRHYLYVNQNWFGFQSRRIALVRTRLFFCFLLLTYVASVC